MPMTFKTIDLAMLPLVVFVEPAHDPLYCYWMIA